MRLKNRKAQYVTIETSWDDFHADDGRLADLLRRYDIPATFYVPVNETLGRDDEVKELANDFEIGSHTINHPVLSSLSVDELNSEVADSKEWLENLLKMNVNSFCYPKGKYNERVIQAVKEAGYTEARTVDVLETKEPKDPFIKKTTIHVYPRKEYKGRYWHGMARDYLRTVAVNGGYFHLWGHSWEVTKLDEWENLTRFFKIMRDTIDHINE